MEANAIIVAAGQSTRFGGTIPKQFLRLSGKPMLAHALEVFQSHQRVARIVIVGPKEWLIFIATDVVDSFGCTKVSHVVAGGLQRQDSVAAGLAVLADSELPVLIHDAARPLLQPEVIDRVLDGLQDADGCIPGIACADTIKEVIDGWVRRTVPRDKMWLAQTPQGFHKAILGAALDAAHKRGIIGTDEAGLIEQIGGRIRLVDGSSRNFKITTAADLELAEKFLALLA